MRARPLSWQELCAFATELQGGAGALKGADAPGFRSAGGTDEILRNMIARRVLGLPKDISVDKDVPFNRLPGRR